MRGHVLRRERDDPVGEALVVFRRGADLPAHGQEHDVEHRDLLGEVLDVREGFDDVRVDFRERVREVGALGRLEGGEGGVGWADEVVGAEAVGGELAPFAEEVEEDDVEGACGGAMSERVVVSADRGGKVGWRLTVFGGLGAVNGGCCWVWIAWGHWRVMSSIVSLSAVKDEAYV